MAERADVRIVRQLQAAGVDFVCSVPCSLLAGVLRELDRSRMTHLSVTREEEGVGICAGAYLGGRRPALVMQNSGLGNSINALLSLNRLYRIPLFLVMGHRGGPGERIVAQVPMGQATPRVLEALDIPFRAVRTRAEIGAIATVGRSAFRLEKVTAVLLGGGIWS